MARRKRPELETDEQAHIRRTLETIANHATRSEKTAWERQHRNLVKVLEEVRPIEQKITELMAKKAPLMDSMERIRLIMVDTCIHPYDMLSYEGTHVICKFCNKKLNARQ